MALHDAACTTLEFLAMFHKCKVPNLAAAEAAARQIQLAEENTRGDLVCELPVQLQAGDSDGYWSLWSPLAEGAILSCADPSVGALANYKGHGRLSINKKAVAIAPKFSVQAGSVDADVLEHRGFLGKLQQLSRRVQVLTEHLRVEPDGMQSTWSSQTHDLACAICRHGHVSPLVEGLIALIRQGGNSNQANRRI